jgi:hypothetical protein
VKRQLLGVVALLSAYPVTGLAQSAAPLQQVVRDFFAAEAEGRWLDAAHMLDLTRFEGVRRSAIGTARSLGSPPKVTVKQLMEMDPSMPVAVAEYQIKSMSDASRGFDYLLSEFARVSSTDSLAALPLDEAAARWLEAKGPRWQTERAMTAARSRPQTGCALIPDSVARLAPGQLEMPQSVVLGATAPSDSTGYVVVGFGTTRIRHQSGEDASYPDLSPRVLALRKLDGSWKVVPAVDMPHADAMSGGSVSIYKCSMSKPPQPSPRKN